MKPGVAIERAQAEADTVSDPRAAPDVQPEGFGPYPFILGPAMFPMYSPWMSA